MKRQFISDLKPGIDVDTVFYLPEVAEGIARNGKPYLRLKLSDRSGTIDARAWEVGSALRGVLEEGGFARIRGNTAIYNRMPQVVIDQAWAEEADSLDQRQFIPSSFRDPGELSGYLDYFISDIYDSSFARLLAAFFEEPVFRDRFCLAPGSIRSHHAYLGGLLEHTISVATLSQHAAVQHPRLDRDLLVTASLLHDIGKVDAYVVRGRIEKSREGNLLGHVLIGQRLIEEKLSSLGGLTQEKELELLHAIISHHGELEWGAPKRPQSAEALVLHHLDNMDAKVKGYFEVVEGCGQLPWREMQNLFRRPLSDPRAADRGEGGR